MLKRIKDLDLPYDLQIDIFNKTIKPILLYGSEIWGYGNCDTIERVHLKFLKYIFKLKKSTPSHMIYGELGILPITTEIQSRVITYWSKLVNVENVEKNKLSSIIYMVLHAMHENKHLTSAWMDNVKKLLCSLGFSGIWYSQSFINSNWLINAAKQRIKDIYLQSWYSTVNISSGSNNYKLFKDKFEKSPYLDLLPQYLSRRLLAFRTRNHKFPIETGRWCGQPVSERKCVFCTRDIGDEYHILLACDKFKEERKAYLDPHYYVRPSVLKYNNLMNTKHEIQLKRLGQFVDLLLKMPNKNS